MRMALELRPIAGGEDPILINSIRFWSEEDFSRSAEDWQELLSRSSANPLFMSWAWQWSWWHRRAPVSGDALWLLAAYESSAKLVGLAPLYIRRAQHRGAWTAQRLESIGSTFRESSSIFSEYLDFIVDDRYVDAFLPVLADRLLQQHGWTDLVVAHTRADGVAARLVRDHLAEACYVREVDQLTAYTCPLPEDFSQYLTRLHSNTRRKLWNHRRRLTQARVVHCEMRDADEFFDEMDRYHYARWGQPHFVGPRRQFHHDFATRLAPYGELKLSRLVCASGTLSLMYNVRIGSTEYNIQSAFNPEVAGGISPSYLHFGYCMENACREGVRYFDFLAGTGRNRDYKQDFITEEKPLATLQIIRTRPLAWVYRKYDRHALAAGTGSVDRRSEQQ